jgi:hypothetical protein
MNSVITQETANCRAGTHTIRVGRCRNWEEPWPLDGWYLCLVCQRSVFLRHGWVRELYPPRKRPPTAAATG